MLKRHRIDAITQACRCGAVVKHVTKMSIALSAQNLGALHAVAVIDLIEHRLSLHRLKITRPAAARIELAVAGEQQLAATGAAIFAGFLGVPIFAGEGALKRLMMCADCRVIDMMENQNEMSIHDVKNPKP